MLIFSSTSFIFRLIFSSFFSFLLVTPLSNLNHIKSLNREITSPKLKTKVKQTIRSWIWINSHFYDYILCNLRHPARQRTSWISPSNISGTLTTHPVPLHSKYTHNLLQLKFTAVIRNNLIFPSVDSDYIRQSNWREASRFELMFRFEVTLRRNNINIFYSKLCFERILLTFYHMGCKKVFYRLFRFFEKITFCTWFLITDFPRGSIRLVLEIED